MTRKARLRVTSDGRSAHHVKVEAVPVDGGEPLELPVQFVEIEALKDDALSADLRAYITEMDVSGVTDEHENVHIAAKAKHDGDPVIYRERSVVWRASCQRDEKPFPTVTFKEDS